MSYYLVTGLLLALGVLLASMAWSYYTHTGNRNETTIWRILVDGFNTPTKLIVAGPTYFLLVVTIVISMAVADGLHERIELAEWDTDIPYVVNIAMQMLGTLAFYLIPLMVALVLDSTLPRIGWVKPNVNSSDPVVKEVSIKYIKQGQKSQAIVGAITVALVATIIALSSMNIISGAFAVSGVFFIICFMAAIYVSITGYYFSGTTYIEIMVLLLAVIVGIGVYSLDFYWNKLLTVDFVLNNLDYDNLSDLELNKQVQKSYQDYANRTLINVILIIIDLFAAAWSLLNKEQLWFVRMQQRIVTQQISNAFNDETSRLDRSSNAKPTPKPTEKVETIPVPKVVPIVDPPKTGGLTI